MVIQKVSYRIHVAIYKKGTTQKLDYVRIGGIMGLRSP
jgi:hypothetical protein